jgi:hypothetical protein
MTIARHLEYARARLSESLGRAVRLLHEHVGSVLVNRQHIVLVRDDPMAQRSSPRRPGFPARR